MSDDDRCQACNARLDTQPHRPGCGNANPEPQTWRITFGQRYRTEAHPVLGLVPTLPDQYVTVRSDSEEGAHALAYEWLGTAWAFLYPTEGREDRQLRDDYVPLGEYVPPEDEPGR